MKKSVKYFMILNPKVCRHRFYLTIGIVTFLLVCGSVLPAHSSDGVDIFIDADQQTKVSGQISDASTGEAMSGVNITVKGTTIGTLSDIGGAFSLSVPDRNATLVFSFIGYKAQEVPLNGRTTLDISLTPEITGLEEVVVIGYGTQKRRDITGSVSRIDVSLIKDVPATNVSRLLLGQSSGVTVKQTTGAPGKELEVVVRGLSSLGASSEPLYVIDGFPVGNSLGQTLNPNDIESITILKDAVSTAIYGARGSNGVILITTKAAKKGEIKLDFTANYGIQNVPDTRKVEMLNGQEYAQFRKDAFMDKIRILQGREPSIEEVPLDYRFPEQTKYSTNWYDEILNTNANFQNYNLTLTEGLGNINTMVSLGVVNQEGVLLNTKYDNYSIRANIGGKINDFISMGLNVNGAYSRQNYTNSEGYYAVTGAALLCDPREPVYNDDGSFNNYIGGHDGIYGFFNPVQYLMEINRNLEIKDLLSTAFLEFTFLKNFKFKSTINAKINNRSSKEYVPSTISGTNAPAPRDATQTDQATDVYNYAADELLTYDNTFGDHRINLLLGFTAQKETVKSLSGTGRTYPNDLTPFLGSASIRSASSSEYGWSMVAYFSRINYSLKDRYLFSATWRTEGSSRFGYKNRYGNFPALSLGWRISEEPFMSGITWLNDLKPRISWGKTGNNNIGNYSSLAFMNSSNYILGNSLSSGYVIGSFANTELGWEKSTQLDIGVDMSALNNKLTFSAEYYRRVTSDMLLSISVPAISGFTSSLGNVGKVKNSGLEFEVGYKMNLNKLGLWSTFNLSFNRNEVLEMRGENDELWTGSSLYDGCYLSKVGRPIGMIVGYKVIGIFNSFEEISDAPTQDGAVPGDFIYMDANKDGVISYGIGPDMVEIGNPWPKYTWGLTLGGNYGNIDLSALFTSAMNYDIYRRIEESTLNLDGVFNVLAESKERWRSDEDRGNGRMPSTNNWKYHREACSFYVYDASHLWIKNISIGYNLPKSLFKNFGARIYFSSDNLFVITNYPGNNPDVSNRTGINPSYDSEAYPVPRTFTLGANITF